MTPSRTKSTPIIDPFLRAHVVHINAAFYHIYIGRGSPWGNQFKIGRDGDRTTVLAKHEKQVRADPALMRRIKAELKGKILGCFCDPLPCHGHTLVRIANEP